MTTVRHQTGQATIAEAEAAYRSRDLDVDMTPFIEDMAAAYTWADLVVCRAGALTVAELAAAGLPAIFVPYPAAVDDHQTKNAQAMAEAGAATIAPESNLTGESLADLLKSWLGSRAELAERAGKARKLAHPDALSRIAEVCLQQAGARA